MSDTTEQVRRRLAAKRRAYSAVVAAAGATAVTLSVVTVVGLVAAHTRALGELVRLLP